MMLLRALLFNIAFFVGTVVIGIAGLAALLMPRRIVMAFGRWWARYVLASLKLIVGLDGEIRGRDNIPPGACLIAMKHQSAWDTLILPVLLGDPAVVIKRELLFVPSMAGTRRAPARSSSTARAGRPHCGACWRARAAVAAERPIVIFPEGTRTPPGELVYQPGVAALYQALDVPLVPAAVNSGLFWGRRSFAKRPGRIVLSFLRRSRRAGRAARSWPRRTAHRSGNRRPGTGSRLHDRA